MKRLSLRELSVLPALIGLTILLATSGCSGLTSAGLPSTQSHGTGAKGGAGSSGTGTGTSGGNQSGNSAPQATVSATTVNFGNVAVGTTSTQLIKVTNSGTVNVTITEQAASGVGFTASGIGSGLILTPGQSATLEVDFTPVTAGAVTGNVPLVSDAWSSTKVITLTGTGVQAAAHVATLSWEPSTSVVVGYNAYRALQSGGPYLKLTPSPVPGTSYTDATVASGQVYYYVMTAVDSAGAESGYSNEVAAAIP